MGKLRVLAGLEVCKILEQNGFISVRQRGSHRIMQLQTDGTTVTVPVPLHDPVRRGTLQSIIRHPASQNRYLNQKDESQRIPAWRLPQLAWLFYDRLTTPSGNNQIPP